MDAETVRAFLEEHFQYGSSDPDRAHALYHEDAVLEFPQSGERFEGVDRDDKIIRETIYVSEGWDAPEWRASGPRRREPGRSCAG